MKHSFVFFLTIFISTVGLADPPWDDYRIVDDLGASREGLHEFTYHRMVQNQLGWADMNPFALYDLGYITQLGADLGPVWPKMVPLMLSVWGPGEAVKVYFRQREGRAKPLPPHYQKSFLSNELGVTRLIQKGGLPTNNKGGHKDGLLDRSESYGDMIWGELLHQNGALSTRGLLAVAQQGVRRNMDGGPGLDAGIMVRFNEFPRLREPGGWQRNYQNEMLSEMKYQTPLITSELHKLDNQRLNWFLALHNEALLKNLWIHHGSYTFDENRSGSLIDFGTTSALWEPNPHAKLKNYTSYADEVEESGNVAAFRMGDHGRDIPEADRMVKVRDKVLFNNVYWSSYAFFQMQRLGLKEEDILKLYTDEKIPGTDFTFKFASDQALDFARNIAEIDKQTMHSLQGFSIDWQDNEAARTNQRVVVNTRKLLRAILEARVNKPAGGLRRLMPRGGVAELTEAGVRDLVKRSFFGTHSGTQNPDEIMAQLDRDPGKRDYIFAKVRELVGFTDRLRPMLEADYEGTRRRASYYPIEQNLPHRREVMDLAWKWANNPGTFGQEFVPWIQARSPQYGPVAEARKMHYAQPPAIPQGPPIEIFRALAARCRPTP